MTRRVIENYNSQIIRWLSAHPIAFNPYIGKIAGSATAGLFLCQLLYWWGKGSSEGWIYKTIEEMQEETCLSRAEQDTAIKTWKKMGILEVKVAGIPPKRHFRIMTERLFKLLRGYRTGIENPFGLAEESTDS